MAERQVRIRFKSDEIENVELYYHHLTDFIIRASNTLTSPELIIPEMYEELYRLEYFLNSYYSIVKNAKGKPVVSIFMGTLRYYSSATVASKHLNIGRQNIYSCCDPNNIQKTCKGYTFKYASDLGFADRLHFFNSQLNTDETGH